MYQPKKLRLTVSILLCFLLQAQGADKYTDENRPYEFGFKIDGQQHRHESKDKDGIIMGEFGFITADDVYHVTVYATDKEGRFKILSMKNIHLKKSSLAASPGTPTRQGHALALPPPQPASVQAVAAPQQALTPPPAKPSKPISIEPPGRSCSSCSLPTTTTRAPQPTYNQANGFNAPGASLQNQASSTGQNGGLAGSSLNSQGGQQNYPVGQPNYALQAPGGTPTFTQQPGQSPQNYPGSPSYPQESNSPNAPNNYAQPGKQAGVPQTYAAGQNSLTGGDSGTYGSGPNDPAGPNAQSLGQGSYPQEGAGGGTSKQYNRPEQPFTSNVGPNGPQGPGSTSGGQRSPARPTLSNTQGPSSPNAPNTYAQTGQQAGVPQTYAADQNSLTGGDSGTHGSGPNGPAGPNAQSLGQSSYPQEEAGGRTSKQYNGPEQPFSSNVGPNGPQGPGSTSGGPAKPTLFSAQMQIVDKNTDINALRPGEKKGLPPGLTEDGMTQLLYTFNYTVGFHAHFEEGYTNGVKKGYYYVTGRNGVRTRIDYVADDTGFHPKVSQEVLDLLSDDVPKLETEKDEKFGLKGYEFKWLYYPVESKGQ